MWWFPPLVLQLAAFTLALSWGVLISVISYFAWHSQEHAQEASSLLVLSHIFHT